MAPDQSVSLVARTYGVASNVLYRWRMQMAEDAVLPPLIVELLGGRQTYG